MDDTIVSAMAAALGGPDAVATDASTLAENAKGTCESPAITPHLNPQLPPEWALGPLHSTASARRST